MTEDQIAKRLDEIDSRLVTIDGTLSVHTETLAKVSSGIQAILEELRDMRVSRLAQVEIKVAALEARAR